MKSRFTVSISLPLISESLVLIRSIHWACRENCREYSDFDQHNQEVLQSIACRVKMLSAARAVGIVVYSPFVLQMAVVHSYKPQWPDELELLAGDVILVLSKHEEERWFGRLQGGQRGYFPASCVMELSQVGSVAAWAQHCSIFRSAAAEPQSADCTTGFGIVIRDEVTICEYLYSEFDDLTLVGSCSQVSLPPKARRRSSSLRNPACDGDSGDRKSVV